MRPPSRLQKQVLGHLAEGCPNKEIARRLGVSERMARKHIENLMRRYSVTNRVALLSAAIKAGDVVFDRPAEPNAGRRRIPELRNDLGNAGPPRSR